jgi:DNA processing protein
VSVVGRRAATAYGAHVATEIAAGLSGQGWTVISGAAYGIDAAAHHGAAVAGGATVAALDGAADHTYPRGHEDLLANVAAQGAVVRRIPARPNPATTEVSRPQSRHRGFPGDPLMIAAYALAAIASQ